MNANALRFLRKLGPIQSSATRCIHCGFCNSVCPTSNVLTAFKETRTSRGRVVMLQSLVEGVGEIDPSGIEFKNLMDLCYSCRRCVPVCPAGIPIPDLISHARYAYQENADRKGLTLGHRIFADYGTFDRLGSMTAPLSNFVLRSGPARKLIQLVTHIDSRAALPSFCANSFESWFRLQHTEERDKKIVYYVDSYANYNNPLLAKIVFTLLDYLGYQVILPRQKESGMPAIEYGLLDKARNLARYNVRQLSPYAKKGIPIVCSSPAASYLLKYGYQGLLEDGGSALVSNAVVDIAEFLSARFEEGDLRFHSRHPVQAVYHYCCLSKALSLGPVTMKLLNAAGITCQVVEECCGGAGVWGTFKENYGLSSEIAAKLRSRVEGGKKILTESETCKLQIETHVSSNANFPLELLVKRVVGLRETRSSILGLPKKGPISRVPTRHA